MTTDSESLLATLDLTTARWYAGKSRHEQVRRIVDDIPVPGHPTGRLLLIEIYYADDSGDCYVLPVVPDSAGRLREAEPGDGVYAALVAACGRGEAAVGQAGAVAFRALGNPPRPVGEERALGIDQTNTSVIVGDRIIKLYRRLEAGAHPEVELVEALAARGFGSIPAARGAVRYRTTSGVPTDLAIVQDLIPGAADGWESLIAPLERQLEGTGDPEALGEELTLVGTTAGLLHAELAAAFGAEPASDTLRSEWRDTGRKQLDEALAVLPTDLATELAEYAPRIQTELDGFVTGAAPLVTRVHGDLHVAQFLRTPGGVFVIDFEGEPTRSIDQRCQPTSPLRDIACLMRSLDHVARSAELRVAERGIDGTTAIDAWISFAQSAVLVAYEAALADSPLTLDRALLRRFCIEKELYEFVYAARILPEWLYAPQLGMRWLMCDDAAL